MFNHLEQTFTFDDVLLIPQHSRILPADADVTTKLTENIRLRLPFLSAPMDTVTEVNMAIAIALHGGIGIIHKNMPLEEQARQVRQVRRYENGFIEDPVTVHPDDKIETVIQIRKERGYKKNPVVDSAGKLVGIITDVDYFIPDDAGLQVKDRMRRRENMVVAQAGMSLDAANAMIREHRIRTLCLVGENDRLVSIVTRHDIEKNAAYPFAAKDENKQLYVGAAIGVGEKALRSAETLIAAGASVLVVDTAHGHSEGVITTVRELKQRYRDQDIIAGNIATAEAAQDLIAAGADAIKVGIGPGSICTTRVVAGIGVPQLSALFDVMKGVRAARKQVPVIADGGIKNSGDIVKALAAGASAVMMGNMFSGTDESPGRVQFIDGRMYKSYRGMGSIEAMEFGSKDRYGQADVDEKKKFVPEGVSGKVPYKGAVDRIIYQLAGGLRSGMGYNGAKTIPELQQKARFIKITGSSLRESHPHDLGEIKSAPNYRADQ